MRDDHGRNRRNAPAARAALAGAALLAVLALAGCQLGDGTASIQESIQDTLDPGSVPDASEPIDPGATDPDTAGDRLAGTPPAETEAAGDAQALAGNAPRVHFAPIVGAPVAQVSALSRHLTAVAQQRNIRLEPSASAQIDHEIRGYFSALSENGQTTVIHVWDVFTPSGQRMHRIQGQERFAGAGGDPWAAVPASVMEAVADRMLAEYLTWRGQPA